MKIDALKDQILKKKREETIKNNGITLIGINSGKEDFDIFDEINKIQDFIYESAVKLGEQLMKNKIVEDLERIFKIIKLNS